jgi:hypothetical protein
LIDQLHDEGLEDKEIAKFMNLCGITTPKGLSYYQELVFVTRRKMQLRKIRREMDLKTIGNIKFFINDM